MPTRANTTARDNFQKHYSRVYRTLGRAQLQRGAPDLYDVGLDELFNTTTELILEFYTQEGIEFALREYGFFEDIRNLGYESLKFEARRDDQDDHLIRIRSALPSLKEPLLELVLRRSKLTVREELREQLDDRLFTVLSVEWLQLQHPLATFSATRPPLPGQHLPGLGLSRQVFSLLRNMCKRLRLDALVTIPSYYHNAIFYEIGFCYLDPHYQGYLEALKRDFATCFSKVLSEVPPELELAVESWLIQWGGVMQARGDETKRFDWFHEPMVSAVSSKLSRYLRSDWYLSEVTASKESVTYDWLEQTLHMELERSGIHPHDPKKIERLLQEEAL